MENTSSDNKKLEVHPLAATFPKNGKDVEALVHSIAEQGLHEPITLYEGKILDGRCRYEACLQANVTPRFTEYEGNDPLGFVVSKNIARRHQTASSKAMWTAIHLLPKLEEEAKARQGERTDLSAHAGKNSGMCGDAREIAAKIAGVNAHYISDAKTLLTHAPYAQDAVLGGTVSLAEALRQAVANTRANKTAINQHQKHEQWKKAKPPTAATRSSASSPKPEPEDGDEDFDPAECAAAVYYLDQLGKELLRLGRGHWPDVRDEMDMRIRCGEAKYRNIEAVRQFFAASAT